MNLSRFSLEGKVALVTGGSRGIGRAIALAFADAGADVAISSRKLPDLESVADEIGKKGVKCMAVASHIARGEESKALVDRVVGELGKIDILVNNAGTNPYAGPLLKAEEWAWDATMNVNLKGPFLLSQLVASVMQEQGGGSIINMASIMGLVPSELGFYSVSKAGLIMLTQVLAREWGQYKIRVNAIAPGVVKTRLSEALWKDPAKSEKAAKSKALGYIGVPEDIAGAALFLASDASSYVTGEVIVVDGGELVGPAPDYGA
ncbi:MAG TPA: SDR family oxidoreductase [Dehalococcoidales bacterium]|nr:SDR family oxidoreductase [Dehalococcoidales bacterium]